MIYYRQQLESYETNMLAPYAVKSAESKGRIYQEPEDQRRLCFQKDRDRVIHSRAFRRLQGKTQVFVAGAGDHYRNRLTHSLEVAQVSRDISRSLGLNQDLAETIALAHDLGHTPFGHAGEEALDVIMKQFGLHYEHNEQSKRIVEILEHVYPGFPGLNLTHEVLEGLMKHQSSWDNAGKEFRYLNLEAQVVNIADEIAYQAHDVDDGLRAGIITLNDLNKFELWQRAIDSIGVLFGTDLSKRMVRIRGVSMLLSFMIEDVVQEVEQRLKLYKIGTLQDVKSFPDPLVAFSIVIERENITLKKYLYEYFYMHPKVYKQSQKGQKILTEVFWMYYNNVFLLPKKLQECIDAGEKKEIVVKDYVAGMTDTFVKQIEKGGCSL